MTTVAITGHRPSKLGNADNMMVMQNRILPVYLDDADLIIQGMAHGIDLMAAKTAYRLGKPFVAVRPWAGHTAPGAWKKTYNWALKSAQSVHLISDEEEFPGNWVYLARNRWMVDNADLVYAIWDGSESGTSYTATYALSKKIPVLLIHPITHQSRWLKKNEAL